MKNDNDPRHDPIIINNDGDTVQIPASARESVESEDGTWCGKQYAIDEILAMRDGPTKKFYQIHHLRTNYPKGVKSVSLQKFSCAELTDVLNGILNHKTFLS